MKKFLLSVATVAMFAGFANAEVVTLNVGDAQDIKGTDHAEVAKGETDENGQVSQYGNARHIQPLESLTLGDFSFTFGNNGGKTEPAFYYPMSTNAEGKCQLRIYTSNSMTISAPSDMPIGKIEAKDIKNNVDLVLYSGEPKTEITFTAEAQVRFESFTVTVGEAGEEPKAEKGDTAENPYSVAEALKYIEDGGSNTVVKYVFGYITAIEEVSTEYGNATFILSASADETDGIKVFRSKYLNNEKFTAADQIKVGMCIIANGKLELYTPKEGSPIKELTKGYIETIDASGVENVEMDAVEAPVYYNLQGVRVENAENGIFIEMKGGKATKVIR